VEAHYQFELVLATPACFKQALKIQYVPPQLFHSFLGFGSARLITHAKMPDNL
jgi:hypothetical protein